MNRISDQTCSVLESGVAPLLTGLAVLLFSLPCSAKLQSCNVDLGDELAMGVPMPSYGAAAGQAGVWNGVPVSAPTRAIVNLDGSPTNVVFTNASNFGVTWNHPGTVAGDQALLDDLGDPGIGGQFRFTGLQPGGYEVWTYAWAPDSATSFSTVIVTGASELATVVGGPWPGEMTEGVTHAVHHVVVTNGTLQITVHPAAGSSFSSLNGIQLVHSGEVTSFCLGVGNAPCPCLNQSPFGARGGCRHGTGGWMELGHVGTSIVSADDLLFYAGGGPPHEAAVLIQGTSFVQLAFKDGMLCTGGSTERIELFQLDFLGGAVSTVSIVDAGHVMPGDRRYYQVWYRDPVSPCGYGMNTSNTLQVDWL